MKSTPILKHKYYCLCKWILILLISGCSIDSDDPIDTGELTFVSMHELNINDPSGLALDASGNFLWTVSDSEGGRVYRITFEGEIIDHLEHYRGNDMEGITMNPNDMTLWVIEEKLMQVVQLDLIGRILQVVNFPPLNSVENDGLEGISINPETEHIYLLHQKNPRLFIELDQNMQIVREIGINFSAPYTLLDLSGLFYDHDKREFWIVSDESMRIVVTDFDLNPIKSYDLSRIKFEGITVNTAKKRIYLVNDDEYRLYIYDY